MKTTTTAKLDALTNAHTVWQTFDAMIQALSEYQVLSTPTIASRELAMAVKAAGFRCWNPRTGRNW